MPIALEGGCTVVGLKEGPPLHEARMRIWPHFHAPAMSMRVLEIDGHTPVALGGSGREEVLYVIEGSAVTESGLTIDRDTGIHLQPGESLSLRTIDLTTLMSVQCVSESDAEAAGSSPRLVRMSECPVERTGDRWYRQLITGQVTQFVGSIPPGRAPDHFHLYEEVLCILQGSGTMWAGSSSTPIGPGSCVFLPRRQVHCVENAGPGELRLLGVFHPAGSPAVRYES